MAKVKMRMTDDSSDWRCARGHHLWNNKPGPCERCETLDRYERSEAVTKQDVSGRLEYYAWLREFNERYHREWCEHVDAQTKAMNDQTKALNRIAEAIDHHGIS